MRFGLAGFVIVESLLQTEIGASSSSQVSVQENKQRELHKFSVIKGINSSIPPPLLNTSRILIQQTLSPAENKTLACSWCCTFLSNGAHLWSLLSCFIYTCQCDSQTLNDFLSLVDKVVLGHRLDSMISKVFSNLADSVILQWSDWWVGSKEEQSLSRCENLYSITESTIWWRK